MEPVNKRNYDTETRRRLADEGKALPDGSYPIVDKADLANALQAIGRATNRAQVEAHIRRRAKALDAMDMLPDWAMAKAVVTPLSVALGVLLADSYTVYHDAHGYHWNVKGQDFAQYHGLFAEIYEDIYASIDDIAENMLKIQAEAPFHMTTLSSMRTIAEGTPTDDPQAMATDLLREIDGLLSTLNKAFAVANSENEQGIANFIAERIDMTQKWAWQLRSSVGMQKQALTAADETVLTKLRPFSDATDDQWALITDEVVKAGGVRQVAGYAKFMLDLAKRTADRG